MTGRLKKFLGVGRNQAYEQAMESYNQALFEAAAEGFEAVAREESQNSLHGSLAQFYLALTHRNLGLLKLAAGEAEAASRELREALKVIRDDYRLNYLRAVALSLELKHSEALTEMERAARGLEGLNIRKALVILHLNAGSTEAVIGELQQLAEEKPKFPDLAHLLGLALARLGRFDEALRNLERAVELAPGFWRAQATLEQVRNLIQDRTDRAEAEAFLNQPLPVAKGFSELLDRLDATDRGLLKTLVRVFEDQIELHATWPDLHFNLGQVYERLDRPDLAAMAYERALELNEEFGRARAALEKLIAKHELSPESD